MTKFYLSLSRYLTVLFMLAFSVAFAQNRTVTGKVTSADDASAVPGVNVVEKGTSNGVVTDANGAYSISIGPNAVLVFSFVGLTPQEVQVGNQSSVDVVMVSDVTSLSEVVVIGYGAVEKKDITGAVTQIGTKDFNKGIMTSPQDMLVGRVAGMSVISSSGAPGAGSTIRIRSGASLNATNDPLIVIDGFPVENRSLSGVANALSQINPNDIESFVVLKDASATAIYGSRASNGVIIVTTKKGVSGKPKYTFNTTFGLSTPIKYFDVMDGNEYRNMVDQLVADGIISSTALTKLGTSNTDWQKEIFRNAISSDNNLSVTGSVAGVPVRASYGYTYQQGILENTDINRHSINLSATPTFLDKHLKVTANIKASNVKSNFGEAGAVGSAVTFDPTQSPKDSDSPFGGYFSWLNLGASSGTTNPVAMVEQTDNVGTANRIIANAEVEYKLHWLPELKAVVSTGIDYAESDGHNKAPVDAEFAGRVALTSHGRDNTYSAVNKSTLLDMYLNYSKTFGSHKVEATGGYGYQYFLIERDNRDATADGTGTVSQGSDPRENVLISFFGRANYSFMDKYLLTATMRNDLSSRYLKENRSGWFPSIALGWRIKDEQFLSNVSAISDLKLRVSYGVTGQQDIPLNYYPALALYTSSNAQAMYELGGVNYSTIRPEEYDANIKWEETATTNIGLDFGLFNNRLSGSFEVYKKDTKDLLSYIKIPTGSNFSNFLDTNIGTMEAKGVELTLQAVPIATGKFTWNAGINFTYTKSEITKLTLVDDPNFLGLERGNIGVSQFVQMHQVGQAPFSFFMYQQVYDTDGNPVEGLYVNRSGEPFAVVGNNKNKYANEKPAADYLMGINSRFTYDKFDFSFSGRLSLGNYVYNNNLAGRAFYNNVYTLEHFRNMPTAISDTEFVNQQQLSDYYVQDASFFKMDNISLGYTMDNLMSNKLKARISLTVQNAFTITDYDGIDPEVDGGIDNNIYPRPRVFLLGVSLDF